MVPGLASDGVRFPGPSVPVATRDECEPLQPKTLTCVKQLRSGHHRLGLIICTANLGRQHSVGPLFVGQAKEQAGKPAQRCCREPEPARGRAVMGLPLDYEAVTRTRSSACLARWSYSRARSSKV